MGTKNLLVANWKMNLGPTAAADLAGRLVGTVRQAVSTEVWIAPPLISAASVLASIDDAPIRVGAQNCHWLDSGAFTGEVSVAMLIEAGLSFSIVGHSERRHIFGESSELVAERAYGAISRGFPTILCVGELAEERAAERTEEVLAKQIVALTSKLTSDPGDTLLIAYEPVWAIGTGKVATIAEIKAAHSFIAKLWTDQTGQKPPRILYGGSVTPDNFAEILALPEVAGALVGGASLTFDKFVSLIQISERQH